jgi:hypothetical protein
VHWPATYVRSHTPCPPERQRDREREREAEGTSTQEYPRSASESPSLICLSNLSGTHVFVIRPKSSSFGPSYIFLLAVGVCAAGTMTPLSRILTCCSFAYKNKFSGTLPSELGNLTMMESFFVSSNKLHGTVPSELGNMRYAVQFSLHNNTFAGPVPSELGQVRGSVC